MFSSSALNNVFVTYYLHAFSHLPSSVFLLCNTVFMVWNALNDPIFGKLSDNWVRAERNQHSRVDSILVGGLLWCLSMIVTFAPTFDNVFFAGLHFAGALCAYDGCLTFCELAHSSLLAELTSSVRERALFNSASAVMAGIGCGSSLFAYLFWDLRSQASFRLFVFGLSMLCALVFYLSAAGLRTFIDQQLGRFQERMKADLETEPLPLLQSGVSRKRPADPEEKAGLLAVVKQMLQQPNVLVYVAVATAQAFDCCFQKNFFSVFLDYMAGSAVPAFLRSLVISCSFVLPHFGTLVLAPLVASKGVFAVVSALFSTRLLFLLCCLLLLPPDSPVLVMLVGMGRCFSDSPQCMLVNRVLTEAVCRTLPLVVSDLVDEDISLNNRDSRVSATVIGSTAVLPKVAQSVAPMLGFAVAFGAADADSANSSSGLSVTLGRTGLLLFMVTVSLVVVVGQAFVWRGWSLKGKYLVDVKKKRNARMDDIVRKEILSDDAAQKC